MVHQGMIARTKSDLRRLMHLDGDKMKALPGVTSFVHRPCGEGVRNSVEMFPLDAPRVVNQLIA